MNGYEDDPTTKQLWAELCVTGSNDKGYTLQQGVIRFRDRIWVGNNMTAQQHILQVLHASGIGGHEDTLVYWPRTNASNDCLPGPS